MSYDYLRGVLQQHMPLLSDTEKRIATHFTELGEDVVNKTLSDLSAETEVSEATIYKLVKKLGFKGFQDFKISVASNLSPSNSTDDNLTAFTDISKNDSPEVVAQKVIKSSQVSLEGLRYSLTEESLSKALKLMYSSKSLHFIGQGGSSIVALDCYHKFIRSQFRCNYIFDYPMQLSYATKLDDTDCVFLFSHSGNTIETIEIAKTLRHNNAKIISLTGNPASPLVELSDVSFVIYSEESAFRSETLTSRILYLTLIDILYVNVMYHDEELNKESIHNIREALSITKITNTFNKY